MTEVEKTLQLMAERMAESQAKHERDMEDWKVRMDRLDRSIDKVSKKLGGVENNIGYHAEDYFQDIFEETMTFGGIKYDEMIHNLARRDKNVNIEFDIFLENGDAVALIEVKYRIHPDYVKEFAEDRLAKFRKYFPEYKNHKAYLGIAGFSFCDTVAEEAKKYGVGIIRQVGDSMEMAAGELKAYC
jgi:hypothetical protein